MSIIHNGMGHIEIVGSVARALTYSRGLDRKVYGAYYTGRTARDGAGNPLYQWYGFIQVAFRPLWVESWSRSDTYPSDWTTDVPNQPTDEYWWDEGLWKKEVMGEWIRGEDKKWHRE